MPIIATASEQSLPTANLRFPEQWSEANQPDRPLDFVAQIEVRKLSNSSGEFVFAAIPNDYGLERPDKSRKMVYSENSFAVTLAPTTRVRAATKQEWESATRIVTQSRPMFPNGSDLSKGEIEYRGKKFQKTGKYWQSGWLSPGGRWLAAFSYTGERTRDLAFMDGGSVKSGDIFWDLYDTVTGEKLFEWRARDVENPTSRSSPAVWIEEHYFLFPVDLNAQEFNVVKLPEFIAEENPVKIQLPLRVDPGGVRVPPPSSHPVWIELPLTKEHLAQIKASQVPQLVEVRSPRQSSSRQLLLAIREQTEMETRRQAARGRESGRDYNYRVLSTYYYAISPENPTLSRFASKEEWESGQVVQIRRLEISSDETSEPNEAQRSEERQFPKLGATSGDSLQSYMGQWTAVFSYTKRAGPDGGGKMFVEIFETQQGNKFSSTEFPYTGSAETLFKGAFWTQDDCLLLPLNASLDSFALWGLPGGR